MGTSRARRAAAATDAAPLTADLMEQTDGRRHPILTPPPAEPPDQGGAFRFTGRGLGLVWKTSPPLLIAMASLTVIAGLLPAAAAWVGKLIIDAVVAQDGALTLRWVVVEGVIIAGLTAVQRAQTVTQSLLRAQLSQTVNLLILTRATQLGLPQFEDAELYDQMTRARREASTRPLSLVQRLMSVAQHGITLLTYAGLLWAFSPLAVLVVALDGLPALLAETRFSDAAFRLFRWRTPETRQRAYYETVIAREDFAKETQLYGLGPLFLQRYTDIFERLYAEDRRLTLRRGAWGWALGLLSTATFYGAYVYIAMSAVRGTISLGEMTMYLVVFKQGQSAFATILQSIGGMYEDNLYLSNLFEFLAVPVAQLAGTQVAGAAPGTGLELQGVSFRYPGSDRDALTDISFTLRPGEKLAIVGENGSGKTTLIKLLTRLYEPTSGRILLDGTDLRDWQVDALRARIGVIFQDFVRYQIQAGENIGVGDVAHLTDRERWAHAARLGMADAVMDQLPDGYETQLGKWFGGGRELSLGQWQKVALSRAFMRQDADILVLDEPTASMDAAAEAQVFDLVRERGEHRMAVLISHRFSTVRTADTILVMHHGRIIERGTHEELLALGGTYAHLFTLQAAGFQ